MSGCDLAPLLSSQCPDLLRLKKQTLSRGMDAGLVIVSQFAFDTESTVGLLWYRKVGGRKMISNLVLNILSPMEQLLSMIPTKLFGCDLFIEGGEGWDGVMIALQYFPMMIALSFGEQILFLICVLSFVLLLLVLLVSHLFSHFRFHILFSHLSHLACFTS
jgi:hypothetical protein